MTACDAIVVGTGQAGPPLAFRLAAAGMRVAVIERKLVGGTCVNTGCTPTKAMVASAYAAHIARRAADYGVEIAGAIRVDLRQVQARKQAILEKSRTGLEQALKGTPNITFIEGHARFVAPRRIRVGEAELEAPRIFVNVGGRAAVPPISGIDRVPFLTNTGMMRLDTLPRHLVIVGGSYIGLEFGQMFRRFGSEVTIVEMGPRLIGREDPEISAAVQAILEREGIAVRLGAKCLAAAPDGDGVTVTVDCESGAPQVHGSHLLLAAGRRPNTDDLGLEQAGVARDERGYVTVDDQLRTSAEGVWALGDCNGRGAFTHTAYNDFEIVAANLLDGAARRVCDRVPAYALYIDPPLGRAGMTEDQARAAGRKILVGRRPMTRVARAVEKGEDQGLMKIVVDAQSKAILGAAVLGPGGDEAIHAVIDVMAAGAPATLMQRTMHIHPTVSELLPTVLGDLEPA